MYNTKITAEEARKIAKDVIEQRHKNLMDIHFHKIIEDIDSKIGESISKGSLVLNFPVPSNSPCWSLINEVKKEYEERGFEFDSYDSIDNPRFNIPKDGSSWNNTICIRWHKKRKH